METSRPIFPALGPVTLPRRSRDLEFSAYVLTLEYRFNVRLPRTTCRVRASSFVNAAIKEDAVQVALFNARGKPIVREPLRGARRQPSRFRAVGTRHDQTALKITSL
jgi:hypothetical protein